MEPGSIEFKPLTGKETERQPTEVSTLILPESVVRATARMVERYDNEKYSDLLVLLGPQGQSGSVRYVREAGLIPNPEQNSVFSDAIMAAINYARKVREENHDTAVLGIGTTLGVREDVEGILKIAGYPVYIAGGGRLYSEAEEGRRPSAIPGAEQMKVYTLNAKKEVTALPSSQIVPIPGR